MQLAKSEQSQQDARLLPLTNLDQEPFLLDEPIVVHGPLGVLVGHLDVEAEDQLRDQLAHFHEGDVLAEACAGAAAELFTSKPMLAEFRSSGILSLFIE